MTSFWREEGQAIYYKVSHQCSVVERRTLEAADGVIGALFTGTEAMVGGMGWLWPK